MVAKSDSPLAAFLAEVERRRQEMHLALSLPIEDHRLAVIAKLGDVLKCRTLDPLTRRLKQWAPLAHSRIDRVREAIEQCAGAVLALAPQAMSPQWLSVTEDLRRAVRELESSPLNDPRATYEASLPKNELAVLALLKNRSPSLCTLDDFTNLSRNTAGKALKHLIRAGYADRPEGKRQGATITEKGRVVLSSLAQVGN